jgi:hypothetical protein
MKDALLQGQKRVEHITSEVNDFMGTVEPNRVGEVDLKPQVRWMSESITSVLRELDNPETKATEALSQTMSFQTSIADIEQELTVQKRALNEVRKNGETFRRTATEDYNRSIRFVEQYQKDIDAKSY